MTCNKFFAQNILHHWSVCRLCWLHFSTSKMPYTVILALHQWLQTDYNFHDLSCDFLQKPSAPAAFNEYLSFKVECEKFPKKFYLGSLDIYIGPGCGPGSGMWYRHHWTSFFTLLLQLVPGTANLFLLPLCLPEGIYSPFLAVLYNVNDINGKTDKQFMPQEY